MDAMAPSARAESLIARSVAPVKEQYLSFRGASGGNRGAAGGGRDDAAAGGSGGGDSGAAAAAPAAPGSTAPAAALVAADAVTTGGQATERKSKNQMRKVRGVPAPACGGEAATNLHRSA